MKKITYYIFKIFALTLFITLTNCEKDEEVFIEKTELSVTKISFDELKSKTKIYNEFQKIKKKTQNNSLLRNSNSTLDIYNFIIDTTNISLAELNSYNSITIPIYRESQENLYLIENLFIHKTSSDDYKSLIFRYNFDETDYSNLENHIPINSVGEKTIIVGFDNYDFLNNTRSADADGQIGQPFWHNGVCSVYNNVVMYTNPDGTEYPGPGSTIVPCGGCDCGPNPDTNITEENSSGTNVIVFNYPIDYNNNTNSDNYNPFENLGSNGNGGSGVSGLGFQPAITKPTPIFSKQFNIFLNNDLTSDQLSFLNSIQNFQLKLGVQEFLEENNYSDSAKIATKKTIDILRGVTDTTTLNTIEEHKSFISIISNTLDNLSPTSNNDLLGEIKEAFENRDPDGILSLSDYILLAPEVLSIFWDYDPVIGDFQNPELMLKKSLFVILLAKTKSLEGVNWPQNNEEWKAVLTIMGQSMTELGLAFVPGSGLIEAFENAEKENYGAAAFAIATVVADFFGGTIIKVIGKIAKVTYKAFKIFKSIYKYLANVVSGIADDIIKVFINDDIVKIVKDTGDDLVTLTDEIAVVVDDVMEISQHGIKALENSVIFRKADDVNLEFINAGDLPPYKVGNVVTEFVTSEPEQFVRVFFDGGQSSPVGSWVVKNSDIASMNPTQIKDFLALPGSNLPNKIVTVNVPAGTSMRTGIAAPNFGGNGGAQQFQILSETSSTWFGTPTNL